MMIKNNKIKDYCKIENIKIKVLQVEGSCKKCYKIGKVFNLKDIIPCNLCHYAFYIIYPYYLTLHNKGWFPWVKKDKEVKIHCPNPEGITIGVSKKKDNEKKIFVRILTQKGKCFRRYKKGDKFEITESNSFCFKALSSFIPYLSHIKEKTPIILSCSGCSKSKNYVVFNLYK